MPLLYYSDHYAIPLPPGHRFPVGKYRLTRDLLRAGGGFTFQPAPLAAREIIKLAHDAEYVDRFLSGDVDDSGMRRIGFPWSRELALRTLASVGGTLAATADALEFGWGGTLAGGTHHAFRGEGSGFCVFNDIAVAIEWLRGAGRMRRAAVIDLDVHQGDGTARIFRDDPEVLTVSVHCETNFPFRKQQSSIDVPLPEGTSDAAYLDVLRAVLSQLSLFSPPIVFYQAGVDTLVSDTLGHLRLTPAGLMERDRLVFEFARRHAVPIVVTMGGGYSVPMELTAQAHASTFRAAGEILSRLPGPRRTPAVIQAAF